MIDTYDVVSIKDSLSGDEEHGCVNRQRRGLNQRRFAVIEFPLDTSSLSEFIRTLHINILSSLWQPEIHHAFRV